MASAGEAAREIEAPIVERVIDGLGASPGVGSPVNALAATASAMAPPRLTAALEEERTEVAPIVSVGDEGPERIAWARSWMLVVAGIDRGLRVEERMKLATDDGGLPYGVCSPRA